MICRCAPIQHLLLRCSIAAHSLAAVFVLGVLWVLPASAQQWTQFDMKQKDKQGRFLWTDPQNWNHGVPTAQTSVEISDDTSGRALHCVIPSGFKAVCQQFELAEHGRTEGTTLRLEKGASLAVLGTAVLSKDRESWFYLDGVFTCSSKKGGLQVGGPWGRPDQSLPSSSHLIVGPEGVVDANYIGINSHVRAYAPSLRDNFNTRATDSEIVVNGGKLIARQGLRMTTTIAKRPGALRLKGKATFTSDRNSRFGIDIWCGVWEIDGGDVKINVGDIEFHGNKFKDLTHSKTKEAVGTGLAVLKLTGDGVSTIHARQLNFIEAAVLDVSQLNVRPGTFKVIDGESILGTQIVLAQGTDAGKWKLHFDRQQGDLLLTRLAK